MVPTTVAVWADAAKLKPSISRQRTNRERTRPFFAAIKRLPAHLDEKEFIVSTPSRWQAKLPGRTWSSGNVNDADRLVPLFVRRCQENFASGASAYCMRNGLNCPISLVFAKVGAFGTWDLWRRRPGNQSAGRLWPRPPERQALSAGIDASGGRDSSVWASVIRPRQVFIMVRKRKIGALRIQCGLLWRTHMAPAQIPEALNRRKATEFLWPAASVCLAWGPPEK